ncbi:hypothetical protein Tco_0875691 [Tanacetum coccineum]|uniref:Uncharacterized protein n=1 Tax=Tanacetum coccineum TaxID=301880 RepID=A0ABQ5BQC4_9ASTR
MSNRHQELASPEQTASGKDFSNPLIADSLLKAICIGYSRANDYCCVARLLRCCNEKLKNFKISKSSSSSNKGLKNRSVFEYILLMFKKLILKKHEVSLDLSRLATTLNRLERPNQIGINKWYQSMQLETPMAYVSYWRSSFVYRMQLRYAS